jgi:hypothetical protein
MGRQRRKMMDFHQILVGRLGPLFGRSNSKNGGVPCDSLKKLHRKGKYEHWADNGSPSDGYTTLIIQKVALQ